MEVTLLLTRFSTDDERKKMSCHKLLTCSGNLGIKCFCNDLLIYHRVFYSDIQYTATSVSIGHLLAALSFGNCVCPVVRIVEIPSTFETS